MSFQPVDESKQPMLGIHKLEAWDEEDVEENASDISKHSSSSTLLGQPISRKHSYGPSWSSLSSSSNTSSLSTLLMTWLRWAVVVVLQSVIIALLVCQTILHRTGETETVLKGKSVETGEDINGLYKTRTFTSLI
jgi:hypothetical protein